ncbi:hypothetical protein [Dysgonomonas capnocytophagoides]|uniref:hypothetical protein n=1 Tax=Dysgonomonas capnocytophagoides TaxID=45254 RepID=UPI003342C744
MAELKDMEELASLRLGLEKLESKVLKPELTDLNHIPLLFEWYKEVAEEIKDFPKQTETEYKQRFMYCILMLYSPRFFAGQTIERGVRDELAKLFKLSAVHVSNLCRDIAFFYRMYFTFQRDSDIVLGKISERIEQQTIQLIQRGMSEI